MKPEELPDAKTRLDDLTATMGDLRGKIQANTGIARAANTANAELMPILRKCREDCGKLAGEIRVAEDAIRKEQIEKAAAEKG